MAGLGQQIQLFPRSGCSGSGFGPGKQHSSLFFAFFFPCNSTASSLWSWRACVRVQLGPVVREMRAGLLRGVSADRGDPGTKPCPSLPSIDTRIAK